MEDDKEKNVDTQTTSDNVQKEQKTETKSEGEKTKKQVAQKGENGEIVFKNQDELDGFIRRMYAKGAEKANNENSKQIQEIQNKQNEQAQEESKETTTQDYTDKIALAMAKAGVDVQKVERAARLIDVAKVIENGVVDSKKLEEEINAVIAEFPELKSTKEEAKEEKGFKFGATEGNSNVEQQKKPTAIKKWNRFNSI